MKELLSDLAFMCSSSNTSSRGFYIFIAIGLAVLALGIPAMLVLLIVNIVKGASFVLPLILLIVAIAAFVGLIVWLKKS